ncbi:MAG: M1 family peptidase, partial [Chitinophagaceae bacterium]|nr:M1 family peptidase [Chitinophagaceae bacterium]
MKKNCILFITLIINSALLVGAQNIQNNPGSNHGNRFEQLGTILPTPNEYRTASGAPGPKYWQQRCDYAIQCELDEIQKKLTGKEQITYYNNSPDELRYLWLQLDENQHSRKNNAGYQESSRFQQRITEAGADQIVGKKDNEYGLNITSVTDEMGRKLTYFINKTMMRVELPRPLKPGQQFKFSVEWNYFLIDRNKYSGRGGYEHFAADGNDLFTITQWYPRLCVYSDFQGWQNHQFTGTGEFALTFGNFRVSITVPS